MLRSALNAENRRILRLREYISATQPPTVAVVAVVAEIMAHPAVNAREWGLGMRCGVAPVSNTRSKSERICGSRIRQEVGMAWFLELTDIYKQQHYFWWASFVMPRQYKA